MGRDLLTGHTVVRTADLETARELVAARYCPHRLALTEGDGRLDMVHNALPFGGDLTLNYMRYGAGVHITPGQFDGFYLVQLPTSGRARIRSGADDLVVDPSRAFVGSPDEPVDMTWSEDCAQLVVWIRREALEELTAPPDAPSAKVTFAPRLDFDDPAARDWLRLLWLAVEQADEGGLASYPMVATSLAQTLVTGLVEIQPSTARETTRPATTVSRTTRRLRELVEAEPERAWRVADLAAAIDISPRALQEACRQDLGTTPLALLREVRLTRVRADLLAAAPSSTTVTEVACRWGFFHLGRFAQTYGARFHELPSQTLLR